MFEDSLVESAGRIHTDSQRYVIGSFALEALLLAVLMLVPYFYPAALPKQSLAALLAAPPPPPAPASTMHPAVPHIINPATLNGLTAPAIIPHHIAEGSDQSDAPQLTDLGIDKQSLRITGAVPQFGNPPPIPLVVVQHKPGGPIRISAGVAEGHLLAPIRPVYPAIAKAAGIQGTVVVEAMISKDGFVKQAHVISGPPMLAQAALAAIERARYQPYRLNDETVEVATTINIVFTLSD
jgi:protein TonB